MANIEHCQSQNTKTLQQNTFILKNKLLFKNDITKTLMNNQIDLVEKKSCDKANTVKYRQYTNMSSIYCRKKIYTRLKASNTKYKNLQK